MQRIEREYAIIYVDRDGESLKRKEGEREDFTPNEIITDYYNNPGFLQWNYYLIVAKECIGNIPIDKIEGNDLYTRKFVIEKERIESFLEERFPILQKERGQIKLIKGKSWKETEELAFADKDCAMFHHIKSFHRNYDLNFALTEMDKVRAKLITKPIYRAVFFTHIGNEYSIAEKKFKLFQVNQEENNEKSK